MNSSVPDDKVIYQDNRLVLRVRGVVGESAEQLIKQTVYGTKGIRYQHIGQEHKLRQLKKPLFFELLCQGETIGFYCLDERILNLSGGNIRSFYGRYLTIADEHKGKGYGRLLKQEAVRYVETHAKPPFLFYSYIEAQNTRSLVISQKQGYQSVATLKTFLFRRYAPQADPRFSRLDASDKSTLLMLLNRYYEPYTFKTFANITYENNYFVLREGGELVAGVQANPVCWKFMAMPGFGGWLMMNGFPASSVTRRFFNPARYQFIALEGLYVKEGREDLIFSLLESVLTHFSCHTALIQLDVKDPFSTLFAVHKARGMLSGFQKNITTHVLVKAVGEPLLLLDKHPVYVSSFDFT